MFVCGLFEHLGFEDDISLGPLGVFFEQFCCPGFELGLSRGIIGGEMICLCSDMRCSME